MNREKSLNSNWAPAYPKKIVDYSLSDESSWISAKCGVLTGIDGKFTLVETNAVKSVVNEVDKDPINLVQNGVPEGP